jgi:hypothetical protein
VDGPYPVHYVRRACCGAEEKLSAGSCGSAGAFSIHVIPMP